MHRNQNFEMGEIHVHVVQNFLQNLSASDADFNQGNDIRSGTRPMLVTGEYRWQRSHWVKEKIDYYMYM